MSQSQVTNTELSTPVTAAPASGTTPTVSKVTEYVYTWTIVLGSFPSDLIADKHNENR